MWAPSLLHGRLRFVKDQHLVYAAPYKPLDDTELASGGLAPNRLAS
jgi:ribonuclease D